MGDSARASSIAKASSIAEASSIGFVGIDPGLHTTAVVCQRDGELGSLVMKNQWAKEHRVVRVVSMLDYLYEEMPAFVLDTVGEDCGLFVCIEEPMGLRGPSIINVAVFWNIVRALYEVWGDRGLWLLMATPTQIKKFVTGSGQTKTSEVTPIVLRRWPDEVGKIGVQEDLLMALAMCNMAQCAHAVINKAGWSPQFQVDIVATMVAETKQSKSRLWKAK